MQYTDKNETQESGSALCYASARVRAHGDVHPEALAILRDAAHIDDSDSSVPVFGEAEDTVYLTHAEDDDSIFALTASGCEAVAFCARDEGVLEISVGSDFPDKTTFMKLGDRVQVMCDALLSPGFTLEPTYCTAAVDVNLSRNLTDIPSDIITRARNVDLDNFQFTCGSRSGGAEARLFDNSVPGTRRVIKTLEATLHRERLLQLAPVMQACESDIHGLVESVLEYTLGSTRFPDPFLRIATRDSRGLPNFMRPNDEAFEDAKTAALKALSSNGWAQGDEVAANTGGILSRIGLRR